MKFESSVEIDDSVERTAMSVEEHFVSFFVEIINKAFQFFYALSFFQSGKTRCRTVVDNFPRNFVNIPYK